MFKLIILCFIAFCVIMGIVKRICRNFRKKLVILVDIDALFEMSAVLQRAEIYAQNKADSNLLDYMKAHFREIGVCPVGLNKAIMLQQKGYTLKFVAGLATEELRPIVAHLLNLWNLRGELYMVGDLDANIMLEQLKYDNPNIIGLIGKNLDNKKYAHYGLRVF